MSMDRNRARARAKKSFNDNRGGGRSGGRSDLRLTIPTKPIKLRLERPEKLYNVSGAHGETSPWLEGFGHFVKTPKYKNGTFIECGGDRCLVDAYAYPAKFGLDPDDVPVEGRGLKNFPPKPYYCVSGWVEEWHHVVRKTREKQDKTTATWTERVLCTARGCEYCEDKAPRVFGKKFWIDFSYGQWFGGFERAFQTLERIPLDGGYVYPLFYACEKCPNEPFLFYDRKSEKERSLDMTSSCQSCGSEDIAVDPDQHTATCQDCDVSWTLLPCEDGFLSFATSNELECARCGHTGFPVGVWEHSEGAEEWETADVYDALITVYKTSDTPPKLLVKDVRVCDPDPRLFDPKYQVVPGEKTDDLSEEELAAKIVEFMKRPLDLTRIHAKPTADDVADRLGLPNLFARAAAAARTETPKQRYRARSSAE